MGLLTGRTTETGLQSALFAGIVLITPMTGDFEVGIPFTHSVTPKKDHSSAIAEGPTLE